VRASVFFSLFSGANSFFCRLLVSSWSILHKRIRLIGEIDG
jgi:hypothetical protein